MFYAISSENRLRFGDVLEGYPSTTPVIKEPILKNVKGYNIEVDVPTFSVIMDPCCSIGQKMISLTPLIKVWGTFFDNPYLEEDLTRVNREMEPEQAVSPSVWAEFPLAVKQERLEEGRTYAFVNLFVYERHELFPLYTISPRGRREKKETNYYMIDFRNIYKACCDKIVSPVAVVPLKTKILQLSLETRAELRMKMKFYFGRTPKEDVLED